MGAHWRVVSSFDFCLPGPESLLVAVVAAVVCCGRLLPVDCRHHRRLIFSPLLPAVVVAELDGRMFPKEVRGVGGACCRSEPLGKDFHGEVEVVLAGGSFFYR